MHIYFVAYEVWEPTGRFFHAWHWQRYETILELSQPIGTGEHLRTMKNLLAYEVTYNDKHRHLPRRGYWCKTFFGSRFLDLDYLRNHMHIANITLLHSRP